MSKYLIALAVATVSVPAASQIAPSQNAPVANKGEPAKPQMIKKKICEENDDPSSSIHRTCRVIEVPAQPAASTAANQAVPQQGDRN
jgi:hypothetical protein